MRPRAALATTLALLLAGCAGAPAPAQDEGGAPAWSFVDTQGASWSPDALAGRPALLFFMATWCTTCRGLAPDLAALHAEHGEAVRFLSVGFDPTEASADLDAWAREHGHAWPHGVDPDRETVRAYGVVAQSSVVVLDADGALVWKGGYGPRVADIRAALEKASSA